MTDVLVAVLGFCAGAVAGLMGVGGGILFVPTMTLLLDKSQITAEATSLLAIIPVAIIGTRRQYSYGNVRLNDALVIGLLSPLGVVLGVVVANALSQRALSIAFALMALAIAAQLVRRALREQPPQDSEDAA